MNVKRLTFPALIVPCAIVVHCIAELAAVGESDPAQFFARHAYLIALGVASVAMLGAVARTIRGDRDALRSAVDAMPFRGRGVRFVALAFGVQIVFFGASQALEGTPVASGHAGVAALTALALSLAFARALDLSGKRLIEAVAALFIIVSTAVHAPDVRCTTARRRMPFAVRPTFVLAISNRPPPVLIRI